MEKLKAHRATSGTKHSHIFFSVG